MTITINNLKLNICLCLLFIIISSNLCSRPKLEFVKGYGDNPGWLKMFVYTPKNAPKDAPLLVALHGCYQSARSYAAESGWFKLADEYGFCIVFPQTQTFNNLGMCFNWFTPRDINKRKDGEATSIRNMVDYMCANRSVNKDKVFITGVSAGAAMSVVMLSLYPEKFQAGASLAGGPYKAANNVFGAGFAMLGWVCRRPTKWANYIKQQNPNYEGPYPKLVIVHGRRDLVCNRGNARELAEQWAGIHEIKAIPTQTDRNFDKNYRVNKLYYKDEEGVPIVIRYDIQGIGHRVPLDIGSKKNQGGITGLFSKDIDFHSTYWVALDMGLIEDVSHFEKKADE